MILRLSRHQKKTSEAMKCLLEIYNRSLSKKNYKCYPDEIIRNQLIEFANTIFDSDRCSYDLDQKKLEIFSGTVIKQPNSQFSNNERFSSFRQALNAGQQEISFIVELFTTLTKAISSGHHHHFILFNKRTELDITIENSTDTRSTNSDSSDLNKLLNKISIAALKTKKTTVIEHDDKIIVATPYEIIRVNPLETNFAKNFILTEPIDDHPTQFNSLSFQSWISFEQLIKSVFIEYHIAFGDYSRLKMCGYKSCHKLTFEMKKGQKIFCSDECRKKNNKLGEKYRCRDNQNKWIKEQFYSNALLQKNILKDDDSDNPFSGNPDDPENPFSGNPIVSNDCQNCSAIVNRGWCPEIIRKNPQLNGIGPRTEKMIKLKL